MLIGPEVINHRFDFFAVRGGYGSHRRTCVATPYMGRLFRTLRLTVSILIFVLPGFRATS
jgi:hypothetical protein